MSGPARNPDAPSQRKKTPAWRDGWFFFGAAWIIAAAVVYGFAQTISQRLLHAEIPRPVVLWVHAGLFFAWLCLLITQASLVRAGRVRWHRSLGVAGFVLAAAMVAIGVATTLVMGNFEITHALRRPDSARAFLVIPFNDMISFAGCIAAAAWWRKRPDAHRRLIFMASCLLTAAAFPRIPAYANLDLPPFSGVDFLLLLGVAHDLVRHRRVHVVYGLALPPIVAVQAIAAWLVTTRPDWWLDFARRLIG